MSHATVFAFFSRLCLSTYFIKKKAVYRQFFMRLNKARPTQDHKKLKIKKKLKKHKQTSKDHNKQPAPEARWGRTPQTLQPKQRPT